MAKRFLTVLTRTMPLLAPNIKPLTRLTFHSKDDLRAEHKFPSAPSGAKSMQSDDGKKF
jgi:hypothetical protein